MNILRWRRKSKKKIKFKTILLFAFSLIMTTFAWFAYSKVLNPTLDIHIAAWDIQYFINNVEMENPIGIEIPTLYPSMPEQTVTIDIINNGERLVDIDYYLQSVSILGETYQLIQEGNAIPSGTENYLILTPTALETSSTTDEATGVTTVTKTVKGAITNDIKRLPFTIEIEHSAEINPVTEDFYGNETSGQGYLKVIANWIGDNDELDSEWGYRVNEYLTTSGETSAILINLVIDSYQIEEETEVTVTMPKTAETAPYLPDGFVRVPGTTLETGLVIKDSSGNEYVWVEVPKNTAVYASAGITLDLDNMSETDLATACGKIRTDLKAYSSSYRVRDEVFATYGAIGISKDVYEENEIAMLKSIYKNGGFYIGRYETGYETGIEEAPRTANSETLQTAVIKQNVYPYNYVTTPQAQSMAGAMVTGTDYTSTLVYGLQWDLVLKYMNVKGGTNPSDLNTDSTTIGNHYDNIHYVTNPKAKYSLDNGATWTASPYEKYEADEMLLTTGANTTFSKQNIYDLAGNLAEWTYNVVFVNAQPLGGTGGDYSSAGAYVANDCGNYVTTTGSKYVGFRVALFSNVDSGATGAVGGNTSNMTSAGTYLPTGFNQVAGTNLSNGVTIQDSSLNQYVWIEVPRNSTVYDEIGTDLNLDSLTGDALTTALNNIEEELQEYATDYRKSGYSDTWYSEAQQGFASSDDYNALKYTMLKSVYKNEGFYIGKYETGTATARNDKNDALTTAVIQQNAYPYNYVTNRQAQEIASGMASGSHTSSLMFGIQWDLVMKYLETKGVTQNQLKGGDGIGSTNWGNYINNPWEITNASAKYWQNSTDGWQDGVNMAKNNSTSILLSTGADSSFSKMGIYDLAGNVYEWTLEYTSDTNYPCAIRGGYYPDHGNNFPASYRYNLSTSSASRNGGFRVSLY